MFGSVTDVNDSQSSKILLGKVVRVIFTIAVLSSLQPMNISPPSSVIEDGSVTLAR